MIKSLFHKSKRFTKLYANRLELRKKHILHHFNKIITGVGVAVNVAAILAALLCLIELTLYFGFDRTASEAYTIRRLFRIPQAIFFVNILFGLLRNNLPKIRNVKILKWIINTALTISVLVWIYPQPAAPWIPLLSRVVYSEAFLITVLSAYSILELCQAIMRVIHRRTNPALILSGSFIVEASYEGDEIIDISIEKKDSIDTVFGMMDIYYSERVIDYDNGLFVSLSGQEWGVLPIKDNYVSIKYSYKDYSVSTNNSEWEQQSAQMDYQGKLKDIVSQMFEVK